MTALKHPAPHSVAFRPPDYLAEEALCPVGALSERSSHNRSHNPIYI